MNTRGLLDQLLKSGQQLLEKQGAPPSLATLQAGWAGCCPEQGAACWVGALWACCWVARRPASTVAKP